MKTAEITPGMQVVITDAYGAEHEVKALSAVETKGHSFPVIWIERPLASGATDRVPWPVEAVRPA
jgi:hypothetical protein